MSTNVTGSGLNAADVILCHAARLAHKTAIIHHPIAAAPYTVTYGALAQSVARAAHVFASLGLARGDRVAILMNDSPRYCAAFLGAIKAGGVAIALNTRFSKDDYAFILHDSEARIVVADVEFMPLLGLGPARIINLNDFDRACADAASTYVTADTVATDPAFWLYSSGTTGRPKGIIHSQLGCAHAGQLLREVLQADESFTIFATSKLFFAFALDNAFLGPLAIGATTITNEAWAEPELAVAQAARYRPDVFFTVPTFFRRLLQMPVDQLKPFCDVPFAYTGGERVPESVSTGWKAATGRTLAACYGMSETFTNAMANFPGREKAGSCGELLGDVEAKLLGSDGAQAAADEPGVLWLRHRSYALGYRDPRANAQMFRDDWFCTNDRFTRDGDGHWWHQGRVDELIKVAGQWVKPGEVEDAALADGTLREAACVVVPDAHGFERLALFVVAASTGAGGADIVLSATEQALARLPSHSQPKWVRVIDELPRTPTGKVQRFRLRALLEAELNQ